MLLQLEHAILQPPQIVHQMADLGMDLVGGLAHARVFLDLLDHLNGEHQQRRRHDHDLGAIRLLHDVVEAVMQFRVNRFRWHEHQRQILRLAGDQVFLRNVAHMRADMLAQEFGRGMARVVALRVAERGDGFERELGVDHQRALVRQEDRAIRPRAVRERELEFVGAFREPVLDDHFHAALAEGAALLLVGEHARAATSPARRGR